MTKNLLSPAEITQRTIDIAVKKAGNNFTTTLMLGVMAGIYIAIGSAAATIMWATSGDVGVGKFLAAAIFPVGIVLVLLAGSELFTGNTLMTLGWFNKKISFGGLMKNWAAVFIGNFIGSVLFAFLIWKGQLWGTEALVSDIGAKAIAVAEKKAHLTFSVAFARAILCNLAVAISVWVAAGANTVEGKIMAAWFPIAAFVIGGYEHVVANMFFIPMGMMLGADVSLQQLLIGNLLPVGLGNIFSGGLMIPVAYHFIYARHQK